MEENLRDRKKRFAEMFSNSRKKSGLSQEDMALELGVTRKTVQNWERGVSFPDFFQGTEWFRIQGLNPMPYYLSFVYPDIYGKADAEKLDAKEKEMLCEMVSNASETELRESLFLISGRNGSSGYSLLQLFTAYSHLPIIARQRVAKIIIEEFEMMRYLDQLICKEDVMPDIDMLHSAIEAGENAAKHGYFGYVNLKSTSE